MVSSFLFNLTAYNFHNENEGNKIQRTEDSVFERWTIYVFLSCIIFFSDNDAKYEYPVIFIHNEDSNVFVQWIILTLLQLREIIKRKESGNVQRQNQFQRHFDREKGN